MIGWQRFERNFTAVQKNGWSSFHAKRVTALAVLKYALRNHVAGHVAVVAVNVEANLPGVAFENWSHVKLRLPVFLMFVDQVVHLPKLALQARSFGSGCGGECMLMRRNKGKLTKRDAQAIAKLLVHLLEDRMKQSTRRTLKIAKLFKLRWSIPRSKHVGRFCTGYAGIGDSRRRCRPLRTGRRRLLTGDTSRGSWAGRAIRSRNRTR